jgi:hypothetical protein
MDAEDQGGRASAARGRNVLIRQSEIRVPEILTGRGQTQGAHVSKADVTAI